VKALLVDGSGLAYRSYFAFARNPLRATSGEATSVVHGFLTAVLRWLQQYDPKLVAIAFDPPGPNFRHRLDAAYKANRPERPADLVEQLPRLRQALAAMRLAVVEIPGWEADDVLATLARRLEHRGDDVWVVSADKDFLQLVSPRVRLLRPAAPAGGNDTIWGPAELLEETGLEARQVVDAMALSGDSTDNVPGVAGIGKKTAYELIRTHGSLEGVFAALDAVKRPALRARLEAGRESAERSRALVRLETDVPIEVEPESLLWQGPDGPAIRSLLRELELVQVLRALPPEPRPTTAQVAPQVIEDEAGLTALLARLESRDECAVEVIASEADPMRAEPLAVAFAWEGGIAVLPCAATPAAPPPGEFAFDFPSRSELGFDRVRDALARFFAHPTRRVIGHDLKNTMLVLAAQGIELEGALVDTMLEAYVLDASRRQHGLDALVLEYLDEKLADERFEPGDRSRDPRRIPRPRLVQVAANRVEAVLRLHTVLAPQLETAGLSTLLATVELPLLRVLAAMERAGVRVDVAAMTALAQEWEARGAELAERIYALAGRRFNLQSTQQLGEVLFVDLRLPHGRRGRAGWSTDAEVLERLAAEHEIGRLILEHRTLAKLRSTYAEALPRLVHPRTGRIHTRFNQAVASTGRLSSSDPNLQNIPIRTELGRRIRRAFVADPGAVLVAADYSQIELRLLAHFSRDAALIAAFRDGADVHARTAARIHGCAVDDVTPEMRAAAKTVNFGVLYGMGARGLADRLGIELEAAKRFIADYFASYPEVRRTTQSMVETARATGFATTLLGRRLALPEISSPNPGRRAFAERVAVNAPIQGSAADIIKVAMVRVDRALREARLRCRMILQVHDELVFDVPEGEVEAVREVVRMAMEGAADLAVPLVTDIGVGRHWAEAH